MLRCMLISLLAVFGAPLVTAVPARLLAQPVAPPVTSRFTTPPTPSANTCLALHWWDHGVVCAAAPGRETLVSSLLVGSVVGALSSVPAGLVFDGQCNRGLTSAVGRGASAGMVIAYGSALMLTRVSRTELERRRHAERAAGAQRRWKRVWHTVRPGVVWVGTAALGGALIGAVDGAAGSTSCGRHAGDGALRGAGVYAASTTLLVISVLGVESFGLGTRPN